MPSTPSEFQSFLTHQVLEEHISASTQNQALSALLFLYRHVLNPELGPIDSARAKPTQHVPTVLNLSPYVVRSPLEE